MDTKIVANDIEREKGGIQRTHQPLVAGIQYCVQHVFKEEKVAHPLRNNNVDMFNWQIYLFHLSFKNRDDCIPNQTAGRLEATSPKPLKLQAITSCKD